MLLLSYPSPLITVPTFTYTLNEQFTTDQAAPLGASRTAQPGPGSWTIVDTNSKFAISGGRLSLVGGQVSGDRLVTSSFSRVAGRALLWEHPTHATQSSVWRFGWFTNGTTGSTPEIGIQLSTTNTSAAIRNQGATIDTVAIGSAEHCFAMIMRATGGLYLTRNGMSGNYRLDWVHAAGTAALFAKGVSSGATAYNVTVDNVRITDLGWANDYVWATNRLASPATGATTTHSSSGFLLDATVTWDGSSVWEMWFNRTATPAGWLVRITADGSFKLIEYSGGSETEQMTTTAGTVLSGAPTRIVVIREANSSFYRIYRDGSLVWIMDGFTTNQTGTGVLVNGSGTSEVVAWPRYIDLQGA